LAENLYCYFCYSVSIFVYRNLQYNTIYLDQYNTVYVIEACAIQFHSTYLYIKLFILAIYRFPRLILQISLIDWAWSYINFIITYNLHRNLTRDTAYTSTLDANRRSTTQTVTVKRDYVTQRTAAPTVDHIKDIPIAPQKPHALLTYQHQKRTPPPQQYTCNGHQIQLRKNTRP